LKETLEKPLAFVCMQDGWSIATCKIINFAEQCR
jgi:hypothetical protein